MNRIFGCVAESMGERGYARLSGVLFPSLSVDILWKLGAVSRVRFAAQKSRALDTAPSFQQILLRRKRREGVADREPVTPAFASSPVYTLLIHSGNQENSRSPAVWINLQLKRPRLIRRGDQPFNYRLRPS